MKVELTRSLKIRLLKALQTGFLETDNFPELDDTPSTGNIPVEAWIKWQLKEAEANLLKTE